MCLKPECLATALGPAPSHVAPGLPSHFLLNTHPPMQGVDGEEVVSWQEASHLMQEKYSNTSLLVRVPQAMWRGDVLDAKHPERGQLRYWLLDGG